MAPLEMRTRRVRSRVFFGAPIRGSSASALLAGTLLVGSLGAIYSLHVSSSTLHLGQVASDTVVAQRKVTFFDKVTTTTRRKQAMDAVPVLFRQDTTVAQTRPALAANFLSAAAQILAGSSSPADKALKLRKILPPGISPSAFQQLYLLSSSSLAKVRHQSVSLLRRAVLSQFDANQITATESILLSTLPDGMPVAERNAIGEVLAAFLSPTLLPDLAATKSKRLRAASAVPQSFETIYPRQVVVRRGDIVTPLVMERLTALGVESRQQGWEDTIAGMLFALTIVGTLFWYLTAFHPSIVSSPRLLLLIGASIVLDVAGARLLTNGHILLPLFLPVAAASTFAAALIAPEACIGMALATALLSGWVVSNSYELTCYFFVTGATGVLAIRQVRQIKQFILAGAYITVFGLLTILAFGLVDRVFDFAAVQEYILAASFNGFVSSALALGAFALLSSFFGITTSLQLLELGQPNQPLMRRLMSKAPGTHNHSLVLASMTEHAAEEIGANSLVAKLGALYHDVGKTTNPHCFVENQLGIGNIHDDMDPAESARVIRNHVSHGLRLARQYRLPRTVLDAIAEHHGTMAISYFLHKARQENPGELVDTTLFQYPGPKPQSKETALLMLADGCEAAVRSMSDHSAAEIRETVRRIFQERVTQGQLDECPLTLSDLHAAQEAFLSVLNGLYHPRIEYPDSSDPPYESAVRVLRRGRAGTVETA